MGKLFAPIRVFISSKTDGEYEQIRRNICSELNRMGCFDPYSFNDQYASSLNVVKSYLYPLKDSDVVMVLIDNKYGVGEGTKKEIEEAKSLKKKLLYIVCNDINYSRILLNDEPFFVEERYKEVDSLDDVAEAAVKSLLGDLVIHYRFFDDTQYDEKEAYRIRYGGGITKKDLAGADVIVDLLNGLESFPYPLMIKNNRDNQIASIAKTILGINPLDKQLFKRLKDEYTDRAVSKLKTIIAKRFDALESYLSGDYTAALAYLLQILPMLESVRKTTHRWIINDIYLDIRNISAQEILDEKNLKIMKEAQKEIDNSEEKLHFPYFDRCRYLLYQSLVNNDFSIETESPSDIKLGQKGDNDIYLYMAEAFLSALKYGSITLLLNFKRVYFDYKWTKYHSNYNNSQFLELIRLAAIDRDYQKIKKITRIRKQDLPNFDPTQIELVVDSVLSAPDKHQEEISTLLLASIGPIFDDEQFTLLFSKVYSLSIKYAGHKPGISLNVFEPIFDAYVKNINRVEKYVWTFVKRSVENPSAHTFLYIPRVLSSIFYSNYSDKYLDDLVNVIVQLSKYDNAISYLFDLVISIVEINDSYYKKFFSLFSNSNHKKLFKQFETIFCETERDSYVNELIPKLNAIINGEKSVYPFGGSDEFGQLLSQLLVRHYFNDKLIDDICANLILALKSRQIQVDDKIKAIQCLILTLRHSQSKNLTLFLNEMNGDYRLVLNETQNMIGNIYNTGHLFFGLLFLDAWVNRKKELLLREALTSMGEIDKDCYKISGFISLVTACFDSTPFSDITNFSLLQFAWKCYDSKAEETRCSGLNLLLHLTKCEELNETIMRGMRDTFLYRSTAEKIRLLRFTSNQKNKKYFDEMKRLALTNFDYEVKAWLSLDK